MNQFEGDQGYNPEKVSEQESAEEKQDKINKELSKFNVEEIFIELDKIPANEKPEGLEDLKAAYEDDNRVDDVLGAIMMLLIVDPNIDINTDDEAEEWLIDHGLKIDPSKK